MSKKVSIENGMSGRCNIEDENCEILRSSILAQKNLFQDLVSMYFFPNNR